MHSIFYKLMIYSCIVYFPNLNKQLHRDFSIKGKQVHSRISTKV